jgi:hypothetical protein
MNSRNFIPPSCGTYADGARQLRRLAAVRPIHSKRARNSQLNRTLFEFESKVRFRFMEILFVLKFLSFSRPRKTDRQPELVH